MTASFVQYCSFKLKAYMPICFMTSCAENIPTTCGFTMVMQKKKNTIALACAHAELPHNLRTIISLL